MVYKVQLLGPLIPPIGPTALTVIVFEESTKLFASIISASKIDISPAW